MKTKPIYNTIGKTYDTTRKPDPEIVQTLLRLLQPKAKGRYLDIASGNYTDALTHAGIDIEGIDISDEMLSKARIKNKEIKWHQAKSLLFKEDQFDGALCTLHHIQDIEAAFREAYRVINKGNFVLLTFTPEQMQDYWLQAYFLMMLKDSIRSFVSYERLEMVLQLAGFRHISKEPFLVTNNLTDHFLYTGKHRPEIYLDPTIRAGISSFHLPLHGNEVEKGLKQLERDIHSGRIKAIMALHESKKGDYLFVVGEKI